MQVIKTFMAKGINASTKCWSWLKGFIKFINLSNNHTTLLHYVQSYIIFKIFKFYYQPKIFIIRIYTNSLGSKNFLQIF